LPVATICVAIIADLVCNRAFEDVVRVVGVAELALSLPIVTCTFEIVVNSDVYHMDLKRIILGVKNVHSRPESRRQFV
jgi:hypothetical protein